MRPPRPFTALALSAMLLTSACASDGVSGIERRSPSYERTAGGALIGGATGGMVGALCCGDPVNGTGAGIIIGVIGGAIIGWLIDGTYPTK